MLLLHTPVMPTEKVSVELLSVLALVLYENERSASRPSRSTPLLDCLVPIKYEARWTPGGPGSVVGIATRYGLDGPEKESRWGEIFRTCPDRPWGPPSPLYNWYRVFPGGKERPGRDADPSPPSSAVVMKG
jgi:hypothetical protein